MIRAVLFDFDGLLLDTESHEYASFCELYKSYGVELPVDLWCQCIGTDSSAFEPYSYLEQVCGQPVDREAARGMRKLAFEALMENEALRPGVRDYLEDARREGLKIGLASSSSHAWVTGYLEQHGIIDYFDCIVTRDLVQKVKPDPELYLLALDKLQVSAKEAIVFEDSPNGSLAALRAGIPCVIVPNFLTSNLVFGSVTHRLESMDQVRLPELIRQLFSDVY